MFPSPALMVMACSLVAGVWIVFRPADLSALKVFFFSLFTLLFGIAALVALGSANSALPLKFDCHLYLVDKALGGSPAFLAGRLIRRGPLWIVLRLIYDSLPAMTVVWYWMNLKRRNGRVAFTAFAVNLLLGSCLYLVVPACGPAFAFESRYPADPVGVTVELVKVNASPNAIPSLHVSSAILFVLLAGKRPAVRAFAWLYLAGTATATMVLGEHYLIDLVLAVPFACFAALIAQGETRRALGTLVLVIAWLLSIRFATPLMIAHPNALRAGVVTTISIALYVLNRRVSRSLQAGNVLMPLSSCAGRAE